MDYRLLDTPAITGNLPDMPPVYYNKPMQEKKEKYQPDKSCMKYVFLDLWGGAVAQW